MMEALNSLTCQILRTKDSSSTAADDERLGPTLTILKRDVTRNKNEIIQAILQSVDQTFLRAVLARCGVPHLGHS